MLHAPHPCTRLKSNTNGYVTINQQSNVVILWFSLAWQNPYPFHCNLYKHGQEELVNKSWLVLRGLDGVACLYDVQSGQLVQKLEHDPSKWPVDLDTISVPDIFTSVGDIVQTVTVRNLEYVLVTYLHLQPEPYPAWKHCHYYSNLGHQSLDQELTGTVSYMSPQCWGLLQAAILSHQVFECHSYWHCCFSLYCSTSLWFILISHSQKYHPP